MTPMIDFSAPMSAPMSAPISANNTFCACLMATERDQVMHLAQQLQEGWTLTPLQATGLAENGLALLQWKDSVLNQAFYLGEIPIAQAALSMRNHQGVSFEGGAIIMREDSKLAQAIAVLDAVWRHQLPGFERIAPVLAAGAAVRSQQELERKEMLARTRVNFSLLSSTDEATDQPDSEQAA